MKNTDIFIISFLSILIFSFGNPYINPMASEPVINNAYAENTKFLGSERGDTWQKDYFQDGDMIIVKNTLGMTKYVEESGRFFPFINENDKIITENGSVLLNDDGVYSFFKAGKQNKNILLFNDTIISKYADISDLSSWTYLNSINNAEPETYLNNDSFNSIKMKNNTGIVNYKYILNDGKWKTQLEVENLSQLTTKVFGFDQIIDLQSDEIKFGGIVRNLDNYHDTTFDKQFLDNNKGKILNLLNGVNFDFDLGYDNLHSITVYDTGINSSRLVFDYRTDNVLLPDEVLIIDPNFSTDNPNSDGYVTDTDNDNICNGGDTKTDSTDLFIGVDDSDNASDCWYSYLEYDVSSITDTDTITKVEFSFETNTISNPRGNDYVALENVRTSDTASNIWTQCDTTSIVFLNDDTTGDTVAVHSNLDLGSTAVSDLQDHLSLDYWGFCIKPDDKTLDSTSAHSTYYDSETNTTKPTLTVTYVTPLVPTQGTINSVSITSNTPELVISYSNGTNQWDNSTRPAITHATILTGETLYLNTPLKNTNATQNSENSTSIGAINTSTGFQFLSHSDTIDDLATGETTTPALTNGGTFTGDRLGSGNQKFGSYAWDYDSADSQGTAEQNLSPIIPAFTDGEDWAVFGWQYFDGTAGHSRFFHMNAKDSDDYMSWWWHNGGLSKFYIDDNGGTEIITGSALSTGTWTHVIITRENGVAKTYINNSVDINQASTGTFAPSGFDEMAFGSNTAISGDFFDGRLDEWGILDRSLTSAERTSLQTTSIATVFDGDTDLLAYYDFEEDPTGTAPQLTNNIISVTSTGIYDYSGNDKHLSLVNSTDGSSSNSATIKSSHIDSTTLSNELQLTNYGGNIINTNFPSGIDDFTWNFIVTPNQTEQFTLLSAESSVGDILLNFATTFIGLSVNTVDIFNATGLSMNSGSATAITVTKDSSGNYELYLNGTAQSLGVTDTTSFGTITDDKWYIGYKPDLSNSGIWRAEEVSVESVVRSDPEDYGIRIIPFTELVTDLTVTASGGDTYTDTTVGYDDSQCYTVIFTNSVGDSDQSTIICNTSDSASVPNAPTNLSCNSASISSITCSWSAPSSGTAPDGYLIQRESPIGNGFETIVSDTESTNTSYSDISLIGGNVYNYIVYSLIGSVNSTSGSNEDSAIPVDSGSGGGSSGGSSGGGNNANNNPIVTQSLLDFNIISQIQKAVFGEFLENRQLQVSWENDNIYNLDITGIIIENSSLIVTFASPPFTVDKNNQFINYNVQIPTQVCDGDGNPVGCVEPILYEIQVTISGNVNGQPVTSVHDIKVNLKEEFEIPFFMLLLTIGSVVVIMSIKAIRSRSSSGNNKHKTPSRSSSGNSNGSTRASIHRK